MSLSLPKRIVLLHLAYTLILTVGAGWFVIREVRSSFAAYGETWRRQVESVPVERLFSPLVHEVARSLLLAAEEDIPEVREARRRRISVGLQAVLSGIQGLRGVVVLDDQQRIQFASDPAVIDLAVRLSPELRASTDVVSRPIPEPGADATQLLIPVFDGAEGEDRAVPRRRLGTVLIEYRGDTGLAARVPELVPPEPPEFDIALPVVGLVTLLAVGNLGIALLTERPARRLEGALAAFKARRFRGGFAADDLATSAGLGPAVRTIQELGGELDKLDARGREREALLATLSHALEDGVVAIRPDGEPELWNDAAIRILSGRTVNEGRDLRAVLRDALARNPGLLGETAGTGSAFELIVRAANDVRVPAQITRLPFETGPGEVGIVLLIRDLDTLRRVETHLLESGRYAVLAHLAAGLAHEIRNPLHAIGINAGVVEQYVGRDPSERNQRSMRESLVSIRDETRRLGELLNNYLGLVRPNSSEHTVDLHDLCRRIVRLLGYTAAQAEVRLRLEGEGGLPPVQGSADRLQQAILNLVLNAVQAMPRGGEVVVATASQGGIVTVTVTDNGPGVPEELRGSLFYFGATGRVGGTGLGLPIVRLIAEHHGGSIAYDTAPGHGARFTLTLPVQPVARPLTPAGRT